MSLTDPLRPLIYAAEVRDESPCQRNGHPREVCHMETTFTPLLSAFGGGLIGLSAVLLMLSLGRVMGATGVLGGLLTPAGRRDFAWRAALVAGMVSAPVALRMLTGSFPDLSVPVSTIALIAGGLIVGLGVSYAGGCTSGHGVCGNARLSPRSIVATLTFMVATVATVYITRHIIGA